MAIEQHLNLGFVRAHLNHFTWLWFIMPMATFGLSLLLSTDPHRFPGLQTIGITFYLLGLVQYCTILIVILLRAIARPSSFINSLKDPQEALYFSTFWLASACLIMGAHQYALPIDGSRLSTVLRALFWTYAACTYVAATFLYLLLFRGEHTFLANLCTPAWVLPILPVTLCGTMSGILSPNLLPYHKLPIIIAGLTFQGLGTLVSILVTSIYLYRLFQSGLPTPNERPSMFIAVGPPSFTAVGLIRMAESLPDHYDYFERIPQAATILQVVAVYVAIYFWAYALWFSCISVLACFAQMRQMSFHLSWYAFIFPNVGFAIATADIGMALGSPPVLWVSSAMTIVVTIVWLFVTLNHLMAVYKGKDF